MQTSVTIPPEGLNEVATSTQQSKRAEDAGRRELESEIAALLTDRDSISLALQIETATRVSLQNALKESKGKFSFHVVFEILIGP